MKKLCLLIAVLVAATVARAVDFSATAPTGQTLYFDITSSTTVTLVAPNGSSWSSYEAPAGRLVIPQTVEHGGTTYTVTAIADNAMRLCADITAVTVPGSVKTIGFTAFFRCTALTSATIEEGVEALGRMAFAACPDLDTIVLPSTLRQIGVSVFNGSAWAGDTNNWTNGVLYLDGYVIEVGNLTDTAVTIAEGTIGLGNGAFNYCHNMPKVYLPSSLLFIGNLAFNDCELLDTVVMRATVPPTLTDDAFSGVPSVTIVVPCGSLQAYASAAHWGDLDLVEDTCSQAVVSVTETGASVSLVAGGIVVDGAEGAMIAVYDAMGRMVGMVHKASDVQRIMLPGKGIYVVSVDGAARKVAAYL